MKNRKNVNVLAITGFFLCIASAGSLAKSEKMTQALAELSSRPSEEHLQEKSVLSPSATYFVLVMLESVSSAEARKTLHEVTMSEDWRNDKMVKEKPGTKGWVRLDTRWWVDEWENLSPRFMAYCGHFRTKVIPSRLPDIAKIPPWSTAPIHFRGYLGSGKSLMWTDVGFSPLFPGGLTKVPVSASPSSSDDYGVNSFSSPMLQTSIIEAWVSKEKERVDWLRIPLEGGAEITIVMGDLSSKNEPKNSPVILFLPEIELTSTYSPLEAYDLEKVRKVLESPGGFVESGFLSLSEWMMRVSVEIKPHTGSPDSSVVKTSDYKKSPEVVRVDRPFSFKITGSAGEVLFEGNVTREKLEEAARSRD